MKALLEFIAAKQEESNRLASEFVQEMCPAARIIELTILRDDLANQDNE